jgi:hypothetical protein
MESVLNDAGRAVFEPSPYPRSKPNPKMRYNGLLHDLRRTFITDAENAGAPRNELLKLSGHRSESTYLRYAIGNRERGRATVAQIESYRQESFGHETGTISAIEKKNEQIIPVVN